MTDFGRIIEIRKRKVEDLRRAQKTIQRQCDLAVRDVEDAQKAKLAFLDEIKTLELDLLTELVESEITIADLRKLEEELMKAEAKAHLLAEDYDDALQRLRAKEAELESLKTKTKLAQSKVNKITELDEIQCKESKKVAQAAEDAEIDSFVETMFARSDS